MQRRLLHVQPTYSIFRSQRSVLQFERTSKCCITRIQRILRMWKTVRQNSPTSAPIFKVTVNGFVRTNIDPQAYPPLTDISCSAFSIPYE